MNYSDLALALVGGALIGLSASMMLLWNGRVAGISGILAGLLPPRAGDVAWRVWFVLGLIVGGLTLFVLRPAHFGTASVSWPVIVGAGLLVGYGTRLSGGCTSGHGVCGVSRLSKRSIVATALFLASGVFSTYVVRHVLHGGAP
jgi:uncharacterized protein